MPLLIAKAAIAATKATVVGGGGTQAEHDDIQGKPGRISEPEYGEVCLASYVGELRRAYRHLRGGSSSRVAGEPRHLVGRPCSKCPPGSIG
jgi:hypothetical protein